MTRREAIAIMSLAVGARPLLLAATSKPKGQDSLRVGVCTYSLRNFARNLAITMLKQLEVEYVSVKDFHLPYNITADEAARAKSAFNKAGLTLVSAGVIDMKQDDPQALKSYFDYAKLCGFPMIVVAPTHQNAGKIEALAKEYNISVAIHNHGPEDDIFPTPQSVLQVVKSMDPRMGLCIDLGHSMRAGADVVQSIADAGSRLLDIHMKDLRSPTDKNSQCDVGDGVMPVVAIFKQLKKANYQGCVNLEYEINSDNPVPGMLHSLGYLRGVLAGLAG